MNSDNGLVDGSGIYLMAFAGIRLLEYGDKAWYLSGICRGPQ